MSYDALDRVKPKAWGKEQKREYAIQKNSEEEKFVLTDPRMVKSISQKFKDHIAQTRKRLGLDL